MRVRLPFAVFASALACACRAAPVDPDRALGAGAPGVHSVRSSTIDVEHYAIAVDLDPVERRLEGRCSVRFLPLEPGLTTVALDLEGLEVRSVTDASDRALAFEHRAGLLTIGFPDGLERGRCGTVVVHYAGRPRKGLWFSAVRDGAATQAFTHGQCEDARWWFPCVDSPADRATYELRVGMPASWTAVSGGERLERVESGGRASELWRMGTPHPPYLATLVAGELARVEGAWAGVPLECLGPPERSGELEATFEPTEEVLAFLSEVTGLRYPYPKYAQACVTGFPFGGMENASATTMTDSALRDAEGRRDDPSLGLIVHEAAHQWFGDLMTCADWSHAWLNEGLATYMEALFAERERGADEYRVRMRDHLESYLAGEERDSRPIVHGVCRDPMDLFFTGHVYQGGATRLHLLRFVLGDEAFFRGLRLYAGRNAGRSVVSDDLRAALEEASELELREFFRQWIEGPGFPRLEVTWRHDARRGQLLLSVSQVQTITGGVPGVFRFPAEVAVHGAGGTRVHRIEIDRRRRMFELPAAEAPAWVRFDPHGWIPARLDERRPPSAWRAIAEADPDVNGRREAVVVIGRNLAPLADGEERDGLEACLVGRLGQDAHPAVRAEAARALAGARGAPAREALVTAGLADADARVRAAALLALRPAQPDAELARVGERAFDAGFSWEARAAGAALRCASRPADAFEWLDACLRRDGMHPGALARLLPVVAELRDPRGLARLRALALQSGTAEELRVAAAREIGRIGRGHPEVRRDLGTLLREDSWRLRREAINSLGEARDAAVLPLLRERYAESVFPPERRAIEAAFRRASGGG